MASSPIVEIGSSAITSTRYTLAIVLAAAAFAGCGGDDDGEDGTAQTATTTETVSRAEYIEQGDELCEKFSEEAEGLDEELAAAFEDGDYQKAATILNEGLELVRREFEGFQALPTPEGDEVAIDGYLSSIEQQIVISERLVDALRDEESSQVSALVEEIQEINTGTDGFAKGYGFKECGQDD